MPRDIDSQCPMKMYHYGRSWILGGSSRGSPGQGRVDLGIFNVLTAEIGRTVCLL